MEKTNGIRRKQLKLCTFLCIWSFFMTGCNALWSESLEVPTAKPMSTAEPISPEVPTVEPVSPEVPIAEPVLTEVPTVEPESTPEVASETETDYSYFEDALFIGDSRTVGLREYGMFTDSDFFAAPGLSIYAIPKTKLTVGELEKVTLEELLTQKDYGKIYLMLGMNELGYNFEQTVERYRTFVEELQTREPEAIIYLCANLHVNDVRTEHDDIFNNVNINKMNEEINKLAQEKGVPYLDVNVLFDDENGNLSNEYTSDDSHVLGKYYEDWCKWLSENISE